MIYDSGTVFPPSVLDVDESELVDRFMTGIKTIACISLALSYPTIVSVSHSLVNAYKNLLAVAIETDYSFPAADKIKEYLANPEAYAAAAPAEAATSGGGGGGGAAKEEEPAAAEEESDEDMGLDLFG
ncbi:ribosomal protein P0 (A0) (L10E) [Serendipita sp. 405]|nr:ribosomal protein P0 (A0) (L10E) [Serendipita sp. 405]